MGEFNRKNFYFMFYFFTKCVIITKIISLCDFREESKWLWKRF